MSTEAVYIGMIRNGPEKLMNLPFGYSACARRFRVVVIGLLVLLPQAGLAQSVVGVLGIVEEVGPIERRLENAHDVVVQGYVFRRGAVSARDVVVGRSGAGKVNAAIIATLLIEHFKPAAVIFTGTAGAVDQSLYPVMW